MSLPLAFTVKHEGRSIRLTLTSCEIFMASEYAGNVNLYLSCDPSLEPIVQESLHLQIPDEDTSLEFIASGGPDDGAMLVFHSEELALLTDVPESLTFLWCGEPLASIRPELAESVPLDDVQTLIDPLEILGQPRMQTSNLFCLGVERDWIWLLPAFALGAFGAAGCFGDLGFRANVIPYVRFGSCLLLAAGVAIAVINRWVPVRQVWFDRNRREVLFLEGRTLSVEKSLSDATRCSVDGFDHVRLCEREYAPELGDDSNLARTDYLVSLEGPIRFAFDDGRVHSRSDALRLARFGSERSARRFAAEVGYHVGLRILVATDW